MKLLLSLFAFLLLSLPCLAQTPTCPVDKCARKKVGEPVVINWVYDDANGQTGFRLRVRSTDPGTTSTGADNVAGVIIGPTTRSVTFPADFTLGKRVFYVVTSFDATQESIYSFPAVVVEKKIGPPEEVTIK